MVMVKKKEPSRFAIAADVVAITHLILGTLAILIGEVTTFFDAIGYKHGGVKFVFEYLDAPIYYPIRGFLPLAEGDSMYVLLAGIGVVVCASVFYGVLTYVVLRFIASLFAPEK